MPGAGFFPLLLGITLSVFSIMLLGMSLLSPAGRSTHVGPERPEVLYLVGSSGRSLALRAGRLPGHNGPVCRSGDEGTGEDELGDGGLTGGDWWPCGMLVLGRVLLIALPSGILPLSEFVPRFVRISGTLHRTRAHEGVFGLIAVGQERRRLCRDL